MIPREGKSSQQSSISKVEDSKAEIQSFLQSVGRAPQSLLMLDFDGTLAPFRKDRRTAFPYPGITSLLQEIRATRKTRIVIISGRDATEIIPLLAIEPQLEVWGCHGLQRIKVDGSVKFSALDERTGKALFVAKEWLVSQQLQNVAEFKTGSVAVHWRGLSENQAQDVHDRVMLGWAEIAQQYSLDLLHFDGGIEVRSMNANKGTVVGTLLDEMKSSVPAAYLGDDITDEAAFATINGSGLSILVGPEWRPTAARLWLRPPREVIDFLTRWLEVCLGPDETSDATSSELNA
ncbi:MAG: trehalose-phosphatase [Candidatus Sulfotelmatobacter sp.]